MANLALKSFSLVICLALLQVNCSENENVQEYLIENSSQIAQSVGVTSLPRGTVVMVASSEIDNWFNLNGVGIGEYAGWFICDGRNGTPDLTGRFVVGRDIRNLNSDYGKLGNTGGLSHVKLNANQIPAHSHTFTAETSTNGEHAHYYDDVTYADGCDFVVPTYRGIASGKANNKACQIGRTSGASGNHKHTITGKTHETGANQEHENRPPFYVIVYIIYKGH